MDYNFAFPIDVGSRRFVSYLYYCERAMGRVCRETDMAEGYCVKCKARKEITEAFEEVMKNGRKAIKGKCPTCGAVMFKIIGGKAAMTPPAPPTPPSAASV